MKSKTNKKNAAEGIHATSIVAAIEKLRAESPVVEFDWTDKEADTFCELTADIYNMVGDDEDTECETHRDFVIVWNCCGVWRVDLKAKTVTDAS